MVKYKCSECGNNNFTAHQQCYHDVEVDEYGNFSKDKGIYESSTPYGPFSCTKCGKEFGELPKEV